MRRNLRSTMGQLLVAAALAGVVTMTGAVPATKAGDHTVQTRATQPQWKRGVLSRSEDGRITMHLGRGSGARLDSVAPRGDAWLQEWSTQGCARTKPSRDVERAAPGWVRDLVTGLAPKFELDPRLVLAVIAVESNFQTKAVSPKNAQGLMQLIPETAARFGVNDPFDPHQNVRGGMTYLRWLISNFNGNLTLALAGYNAGEKAVERHKGVPPYRETQDYVKRVHALYGCRQAPSPRPSSTLAAGADGDAWADGSSPYDVWSAAASSVDRTADPRCQLFAALPNRQTDRRLAAGFAASACR